VHMAIKAGASNEVTPSKCPTTTSPMPSTAWAAKSSPPQLQPPGSSTASATAPTRSWPGSPTALRVNLS